MADFNSGKRSVTDWNIEYYIMFQVLNSAETFSSLVGSLNEIATKKKKVSFRNFSGKILLRLLEKKIKFEKIANPLNFLNSKATRHALKFTQIFFVVLDCH